MPFTILFITTYILEYILLDVIYSLVIVIIKSSYGISVVPLAVSLYLYSGDKVHYNNN